MLKTANIKILPEWQVQLRFEGQNTDLIFRDMAKYYIKGFDATTMLTMTEDKDCNLIAKQDLKDIQTKFVAEIPLKTVRTPANVK